MIGLKGQTKAIKEYLEAGHTITNFEAFEKFGCTRLSAKIFELRKAGYDITTQEVETVNRYGIDCRYARYKLVK